MKLGRWLFGVAACVSLVAAPAAQAQDFPAKPVRIIVPYPAGGSSDALARLLASRLKDRWDQTVLVENRPGAASITGTKLVAESALDGYTLGIVANGLAVNPSLHARMPFDTVRDIKPVTQLTFTPNVLVAAPQAGIPRMSDLVQRARATPGKITSGSIGNGTASHLALERFKGQAGIDLLHVPFQGAAPGVTAVLGGHTDLMMVNLPDVLPHIRSGRLVALAVASAQRQASLPEVPTFVEAGFDGFISGAWYGIAVRSGTPDPIVRKLQQDFSAALNAADVREQILKSGFEPIGSTSEAFEQVVREEMRISADLVRRAGIRVD